MNCQSTTGMDQMDAFDQEDNPCAAVIYLVNEKKTEKAFCPNKTSQC